MHIVAVYAAHSCVQMLSQIPEVNWNIYSSEGKTALIYAVQNSKASIIEKLVGAGAKLEIVDKFNG